MTIFYILLKNIERGSALYNHLIQWTQVWKWHDLKLRIPSPHFSPDWRALACPLFYILRFTNGTSMCHSSQEILLSRTNQQDCWITMSPPWTLPYGPSYGRSNSLPANLCTVKDRPKGEAHVRAEWNTVCILLLRKIPCDKFVWNEFGQALPARRGRARTVRIKTCAVRSSRHLVRSAG